MRALEYSRTNRERLREYNKKRYWSDPEKFREKTRTAYWANPDYHRAYSLRRCKEKPEVYRMYANTRRARIADATPQWVSMADLQPVFTEAARATRESGIPYEVDHIYPIKHERLCGLHVPWNLRVITKKENNRKKNRTPEEMANARD